MIFSVVLSSVPNDEMNFLAFKQSLLQFKTVYHHKLIDSKLVDRVLILGQIIGTRLAHYCANIHRNVLKQANWLIGLASISFSRTPTSRGLT
jgi:hypothetical protein